MSFLAVILTIHKVKRFPPVFGLGAAVGLAHGLFYVLGNRIDSFNQAEDEFERKEILRRNKRRPIAETIAEVGEGRGTFISQRLVLKKF